jgi:hypothetical protein
VVGNNQSEKEVDGVARLPEKRVDNDKPPVIEKNNR